MKNITLLVLFCLLFGNCTNNKELKKKEITISYLSIKKLNSDSWIKIDNHKFNHVKKYTISDINSNRKELPSKKIILTIIKDKELKENVSQIMLLKILYSKLTKLDDNYYTPTPLSVTAKGELILKRKDNKPIRLSTSNKYPIKR